MDINRERRYFNCGGLGHIACYYRNRENIRDDRRISYRNSESNINIDNLKRREIKTLTEFSKFTVLAS